MIKEIVDLLSDDTNSLSIPLLKTKVFASRIGNKDLSQWVSQEINGYSVDEEIPDYRLAKTTNLCTLSRGYNIQQNQTLPLSVFDEDMAAKLLHYRFEQGVKALEDVASGKHGDTLAKNYGADFSAMLSRHAMENGAQFRITDVRTLVHINEATNALGKIRSKLLDLLLSLEEQYPDLDKEIEKNQINKEEISQTISRAMTQINIHTSGHGNIINTGDHSSITAKIRIGKGDIDAVTTELEKFGVAQEDIQEVREILTTEPPEPDGYGQKVKAWMSKMLGKAVEGSWQIGLGTAGGVLTEILKKFYGF